MQGRAVVVVGAGYALSVGEVAHRFPRALRVIGAFAALPGNRVADKRRALFRPGARGRFLALAINAQLLRKTGAALPPAPVGAAQLARTLGGTVKTLARLRVTALPIFAIRVGLAWGQRDALVFFAEVEGGAIRVDNALDAQTGEGLANGTCRYAVGIGRTRCAHT